MKLLEQADGTTTANRSNKFDVLNPTGSGVEVEEVNAVDVVQEIVATTVDSGAAKNKWPIRKKRVTIMKATRTVRLAAASGGPIQVEGGARLEFVRDGNKCNVKFLDADVKRPLASVSAIVDEGNVVVFGSPNRTEDTSTDQRIPMCGRQCVFVVQLDARAGARSAKTVKFDEPNANERMPVFRRPA